MAGGFTLDFYDPLRTSATDTGLPLARDITAPIAYAATQEGDAWLEDFLDPDDNDAAASLRMTEPFQPGKIPLVLVHGLASSPVTWSHLENDLRAQPAIMARYQIWAFRYDTGDPFLTSAAELRQQLAALRQIYDPMRGDPSLSRMVMVGHSLGGLVSKLQVTYSNDELWQSAAQVPFDTIRTDPDSRMRLANSFFFTPSPDVSRVIYIATPHRGSVYARRCVGQISSALGQGTARLESTARATHPRQSRRLLRRNESRHSHQRRSVGTFERHPASDRRGCPIGKECGFIRSSATTAGRSTKDNRTAWSRSRVPDSPASQSEIFVDASHTEILKRPETSSEVLRILCSTRRKDPRPSSTVVSGIS